MKTALKRYIPHVLLLSVLPVVATLADTLGDDPSAADYLSFETKIDGRCHNLSEGGKLVVMYNRHPQLRIDFRLIRYHVDVPQWGRVTGTAEPHDVPVKLGCTRVGGREQHWEVERANFNREKTP